MSINKYKINEDFFINKSEELYYFLGFIAADGYITDSTIEIGFNKKDLSILEKFRDLIITNKPIYYKRRTNSYTLKIQKKFIKDFIRGYIDGDGYIDSTKSYYKNNIYVGPRIRVLGNKYFLDSFNKKTKLLYKHNVNKISKKGKENVYIIDYNFKTAKELLKIIYLNNNICLKRKYNRVLKVIEM